MKFHALLFALSIAFTGLGQDIKLPTKVKVGLPVKFASYHIDDSYSLKTKAQQKNHWIVYADRGGTPVFQSSTSSSKVIPSGLELGRPMYVADVENGRALVFDMIKDVKYPHIAKEAEAIGWVDLSHCVLSRFCLKGQGLISGEEGKTFALPRKALLTRSFGANTKETVRFKSQPSTSSLTRKSMAFRFEPFYIIKSEGDWLLFATTDQISQNSIRSTSEILGWLNKSEVTEWTTRTTIEPNWTLAAQRKFQEGIVAFEKSSAGKAAAENFKKERASLNNHKDQTLASFDADGNRLPGETMRPISLENEDGVVHSMLTLSTKAGRDMSEQIKLLRESMNNLNIIFVIDGTKSMSPYYEACVEAIDEASRGIRASKSESNIKFGAVIYRDLVDPEPLALYPLARGVNTIKTFLRNVECSSSPGDDIPESVFYGLYDGVKQVSGSLQPGHSNVIIHIGDAGNPDLTTTKKVPANGKNATQQDIARLIDEDSFSYIAFQVNRGRHPSYFHFGQQVKDIMDRSMNNNSMVTASYWEKTSQTTYQLEVATKGEAPPIYPVFELTLAENGPTSPSKLSKSIEAVIKQMDDLTQDRIVWCEEQSKGGEVSPEFILYMQRLWRSQGDSEKTIQRKTNELKSQNNELLFEGYANQEVDWEENPPYRSVIYLSEKEFNDLMNDMKKLNALESKGAQTQRNEFIDILVGQVLASAGLNVNSLEENARMEIQEELEKQSISTIWKSLFGYVPDYDPAVINLPLERLEKEQSTTSEKGVSARVWKEFFDSFLLKYSRVSKYTQQRYPVYKLVGMNRYYWIDAQEMP